MGFTIRQGGGPYRKTAWKGVHYQAGRGGGRTIQEDSLEGGSLSGGGEGGGPYRKTAWKGVHRQAGRGGGRTIQEDSLEGGSLSGGGEDHTGRQPGRGFTVRQGGEGGGPYRKTAWKGVHCQTGGRTIQEDSLEGGSLSGRGKDHTLQEDSLEGGSLSDRGKDHTLQEDSLEGGSLSGRGKDHTLQEDSLEEGSLSGRGKDHTGRHPGKGFTVRQGGVGEGGGGEGPYTTGRQPGRRFTVRQGEGPFRTTVLPTRGRNSSVGSVLGSLSCVM